VVVVVLKRSWSRSAKQKENKQKPKWQYSDKKYPSEHWIPRYGKQSGRQRQKAKDACTREPHTATSLISELTD
jgi:hypothetical protein